MKEDSRSQNMLVIFTLPHGLRRHWDRLRKECSVWEEIGRGIIAWSINEFINSQQDRKTIPEIKVFHDQFIAHTYNTLSTIPKGFWVESTKWSDQEVQVTFSREYKACIPFWDRVIKVDEPAIKRFEAKGCLINKHLNSGISEVAGSKMPGHYIPTMMRQLEYNHYPNSVMQDAFNQGSSEGFAHFYIGLSNPDFFDGFYHAMVRFLKGEKESVVQRTSNEIPSTSPRSSAPTWAGKPQKVSIEGKIFKNPNKVANEKGLAVNQVYSRLYSHLPVWKDWYFIGTKKDPNCH